MSRKPTKRSKQTARWQRWFKLAVKRDLSWAWKHCPDKFIKNKRNIGAIITSSLTKQEVYHMALLINEFRMEKQYELAS